MEIYECLHGALAYKLGPVMGQHIDIFAQYIGETDIIARFSGPQLRAAVLVSVSADTDADRVEV